MKRRSEPIPKLVLAGGITEPTLRARRIDERDVFEFNVTDRIGQHLPLI